MKSRKEKETEEKVRRLMVRYFKFMVFIDPK